MTPVSAAAAFLSLATRLSMVVHTPISWFLAMTWPEICRWDERVASIQREANPPERG